MKRLCFAMLALGAFLPACNRELAEFESIGFGETYAGRLRPASRSAHDAFALVSYRDEGSWPFPAVVAAKNILVLTDPNGMVEAKLYFDQATGHWLVVQTSVVRWILEAQIPENFFHESLDERVALFLDGVARTEAAGRPLSEGLPPGSRQARRRGFGSGGQFTCDVSIPVDPNRCRTDFRDYRGVYVSAGLIDLGEHLDLTGVDVAALKIAVDYFSLTRSEDGLFLEATCTFEQDANNVLYCLDQTASRLFQSVHGYGDIGLYHGLVLFKLLYLTESRSGWGRRSTDYWLDLRGITKTGFDASVDIGGGVRVRFRNLGDRRIRIEYTFFRMADPLFLGGFD